MMFIRVAGRNNRKKEKSEEKNTNNKLQGRRDRRMPLMKMYKKREIYLHIKRIINWRLHNVIHTGLQ